MNGYLNSAKTLKVLINFCVVIHVGCANSSFIISMLYGYLLNQTVSAFVFTVLRTVDSYVICVYRFYKILFDGVSALKVYKISCGCSVLC